MPQTVEVAQRRSLKDRLPEGLSRRFVGITVALLLEALLILALLTLSASMGEEDQPADVALVSFDAGADDPEPAKESPEASAAGEPVPQPVDRPQPPQATPLDVPPQPTPPIEIRKPAFIPMRRDDMASADISNKPSTPPAPKQGPVGPPDTGTPGDSKRVDGTGPNGEPLYAAAWYREPYPEELRGYLSTASGPGWGLIACRTVPNFRVEDCVPIAEHPTGSGINRAVLAAAWQFQVRPPRVGGASKVGEWVRIRIDYTQRPR